MKIDTDIRQVKGIGDKTAALLAKVGIVTAGDALSYFPRYYERFTGAESLESLLFRLPAGSSELAVFAGTVVGLPQQKKVRKLTITKVTVTDGSGSAHLTFFNMPYLKQMLKPEKDFIFRGNVTVKGGSIYCDQPKIYKEADFAPLIDSLQPRYPLTAGLTSNTVTKLVKNILSQYHFPPDFLPSAIKREYSLSDRETAIRDIHFPADMAQMLAARRRLVFDEFLLFIITVRRLRAASQNVVSKKVMLEVGDTKHLLESLPYSLTAAQERVWEEIKIDLSGQWVMHRLIQGDVGSGKTIIAVLALLMCVANGYQGAMMAPTEVLAAQHYQYIKELIEKYKLPFKPLLLTGSLTQAEKRERWRQIATAEVNLIIGTHALITEKVEYANLALVITDEQHRFGVRERAAFMKKGTDTHVLVMSATPIPRTLAIIIYGDLSLSVLDELPANRLPIKNCVVDPSYQKTAYKFIEREIATGHQAFVVCPLAMEGELDGVENVIDYTQKLKSELAEHIRIAALHGQMKAAEKDRIMTDFAAGNIDLLVATTVIEVGINVPNATVMMVENAERFGLAQLHQLRGRIGRGNAQSYTIFVSKEMGENANERLKVLAESNDGFHIAAEDMRLRGPGDMFGTHQSGALSFLLADIYTDARVLEEAALCAERILSDTAGISAEEIEKLFCYIEETPADQSSSATENRSHNSQVMKAVDFHSI
ncbi:MAG: ATP-dependent DNA helicase RecG [Lachnospiraceae bacterium]|jgi:ATP-dependent DNA helicase RecG|nr:ATP-dependent DNA helicase RecG [Lachnospiraceae bacterium]